MQRKVYNSKFTLMVNNKILLDIITAQIKNSIRTSVNFRTS